MNKWNIFYNNYITINIYVCLYELFDDLHFVHIF